MINRKKVASRIADIEPFRVVEVLTRAHQLEASGLNVFHLEAGEPDFDTADPIKEAAIEAIKAGNTHYTAATGIPELREKIAAFYHTEYGVTVDPRRILVTPGASGALMLAAALLADPGSSVLMADPGYPCNRHFFRMVEGQAILVPVDAADRYQLNADKAAQYWREDTMGAIVASPANPTGSSLTDAELRGLLNLTAERGGHLIVDEIYHGLEFGKPSNTVLAQSEDCFVVNSFSKYFGMTGWRLGWLVAPEWAVEGLEKLAQNLFISMSTPAQYGALACFEPHTRQLLDQRREAFASRKEILLKGLRELGFSIPIDPAGGLYIYANIEKFSDDCEVFCRDMLENHGIAITPGTDFGHHLARQHVRFSYTLEQEKIEQALAIMRQVLPK